MCVCTSHTEVYVRPQHSSDTDLQPQRCQSPQRPLPGHDPSFMAGRGHRNNLDALFCVASGVGLGPANEEASISSFLLQTVVDIHPAPLSPSLPTGLRRWSSSAPPSLTRFAVPMQLCCEWNLISSEATSDPLVLHHFNRPSADAEAVRESICNVDKLPTISSRGIKDN